MKKENTKIRDNIFNILLKSEIPLSAYDIHNEMLIPSDLATIYRGLNFLHKKHKIENFSFSCTHERMKKFYYTKNKTHIHFFHCDKCHKFYPYFDCIVKKTLKAIQNKYSFKIKSHFLTFNGICKKCLP